MAEEIKTRMLVREQLNDSNWDTWSIRMKKYLKKKELWEAVEGFEAPFV